MSATAWFLAAVIVALLLWLTFRRKRVADEMRVFTDVSAAVSYAIHQQNNGFDCYLRQRRYAPSLKPHAWEVHCYRRQERKE